MRHLLKDRTAQRDFLWRDPAAAEFVEDLPAVQESEDIIRTFVAQTFPAVGIDMVHHQAYMCLTIDGDIFSFRQKIADELMVPLCGALLLGSVWITVKDLCPLLPFFCGLDGRGIGEFTAVVSQDQGKDLFEAFSAQRFIKAVEDIGNRSGAHCPSYLRQNLSVRRLYQVIPPFS